MPHHTDILALIGIVSFILAALVARRYFIEAAKSVRYVDLDREKSKDTLSIPRPIFGSDVEKVGDPEYYGSRGAAYLAAGAVLVGAIITFNLVLIGLYLLVAWCLGHV